jgi:putative oxidoreductase
VGLRDVGLLVSRGVLGGYLAAHGAQKLWGAFEGPGLEKTAAGFEHLGMRPGKVTAAAAGVSEFGGGVLTALGLADPMGPMVLTGTMAVAMTTHRKNGPFAGKGGYELALTNLAAAVALWVSGPGRYRMGPGLPKSLIKLGTLAGAGAAGYTISQQLRTAREAERQTAKG